MSLGLVLVLALINMAQVQRHGLFGQRVIDAGTRPATAAWALLASSPSCCTALPAWLLHACYAGVLMPGLICTRWSALQTASTPWAWAPTRSAWLGLLRASVCTAAGPCSAWPASWLRCGAMRGEIQYRISLWLQHCGTAPARSRPCHAAPGRCTRWLLTGVVLCMLCCAGDCEAGCVLVHQRRHRGAAL